MSASSSTSSPKSGRRFRWLVPLLKVALAVGLLYGLYHQLFVQRDSAALTAHLRERLSTAPLWMPIVIALLVPFNIALEGIKFRLLLPLDHRPSVTEAVMRVCAGLSVGLFTPNRVGEYAGRLTGTHAGQRASTVAATLLGGAAQWIPLLWGGALAVVLWPTVAINAAPIAQWQVWLAVASGALLTGVFASIPLLANFVVRVLRTVGSGFSESGRIRKAVAYICDQVLLLGRTAAAHPRDVYGALAIACARYSIYLAQITLAFVYCGLDAPAPAAVAGTAAILLAQTFIPLPAVVQAVARVELALVLWGAFAPNELGLATASLLIFVLNLGLPALVGLVVILRSNVDTTPSHAST